MKRLFRVAVGDPLGIELFLAARLAVEISKAREWLERGSIEVNGHRTGGNIKLSIGDQIRLCDAFANADATPYAVVYQDDDLLITNKPAGLLSQPSPAEKHSLEVLVQREHSTARLMHRLDRGASGLVLFALRPKAYAKVQVALVAGSFERLYRAVVLGLLVAPVEIRLRIARDRRDVRRRMALPEQAPGGQSACTRVRPLGSHDDKTTIEVALETGRTHQIRVHLAALGHPLLGDTLYGGPPAQRLMLQAFKLILPHPTTGQRIEFVAPPEFE